MYQRWTSCPFQRSLSNSVEVNGLDVYLYKCTCGLCGEVEPRKPEETWAGTMEGNIPVCNMYFTVHLTRCQGMDVRVGSCRMGWMKVDGCTLFSRVGQFFRMQITVCGSC